MQREAKPNSDPDLACVVWTRPGSPIPGDLDRVLRARGLKPVRAESGFGAFAELCVAERSGDTGRRGVRSLLILAGIDEPWPVLAGLERFASSARVWMFDRGANPPLRARVASPVSAAVNQPEPTRADLAAVTRLDRETGSLRSIESDRPAAVTELKLGSSPEPQAAHARRTESKETNPDQASPGVQSAQRVSARDILDDAELEMLLSGERGDDKGSGA